MKLEVPCLIDIFRQKPLEYDMRISTKVEQPVRRTTNFGLRTFSYVGAKLWNDLPQDHFNVLDMELEDFKCFLKRYTGSSL